MYTVPKETRFIGKKLIYLPECSSTNSEALRFTDEQGIQDGLVIVCHDQFAGRGQSGNKWISEPGKNLTFSVVFENPVSPDRQFYLNIAASLASAKTIQKLSDSKTQIKWPNDLLVDNNKIGGILIENVLRGNMIRYSVVGIGLNINQTTFDQHEATSFSILTGRFFELNDVLSELLLSLELEIDRLRGQEFSSLKSEWMNQLYLLGREHQFRTADQTFIGVIRGIDEAGRLELVVDGEKRRFSFKEISFR